MFIERVITSDHLRSVFLQFINEQTGTARKTGS